MRCGMSVGVVVLVLVCSASWASAPKGSRDAAWKERRAEETNKANSNFEFKCIDSTEEVSYLLVFYSPWDRSGYFPVEMPPLDEDILERIVQASGRFAHRPGIVSGLIGQANTILNTKLDDINSGKFNAIYVRIGASLHLGIAPVDETTIHVWIPEKKGKDPKAHQVKELDEEVWVFDTSGQLLATHSKREAAKLPQTAAYQRGWAVGDPGEGYYEDGQKGSKRRGAEGWNNAWGRPGFWTYASWPPMLNLRAVKRCLPEGADGARH